MTCDAPFPNLCCDSADECSILTDPDYLVVRELVRELMVRDESTFHNARVLNFFKKLDAAGYAISRKHPTQTDG
jgi:hypothetical protein